MAREEIRDIVKAFAGGDLSAREADYLHTHERRYAHTIDLLPPAGPGHRLLDVGIFPGHMAALARARGFEVHGLSNEEMTAEFRLRSGRAGFQIRQADVEVDLFPYADGEFEVVICSELIEHMCRNPFHVLGEIFRVLKPGGALVLTTPNLARVPILWGLFRGRSYMPPMDGPLDESFPLNPNYKHSREYTASEIEHLLCRQDHEPYQFVCERALFSNCWDPTFRDAARVLKHPVAGWNACITWLAQALFPGGRSCLMFRVRKPQIARWVVPDAWTGVRGFHDLEADTAPPTLSRRPLPAPFRWTTGRAGFAFAHPEPGKPAHLRIPCGYLAPESAPELKVVFKINGQPSAGTTFRPLKAYRVVTLPIPESARSAPELEVEIETSTWRPRDLGYNDDRELGIMVTWSRLLVVGEG